MMSEPLPDEDKRLAAAVFVLLWIGPMVAGLLLMGVGAELDNNWVFSAGLLLLAWFFGVWMIGPKSNKTRGEK